MLSTYQYSLRFLINPLLPAFILLLILIIRKEKRKNLLCLVFVYLYFISIPLSSKIISIAWSVDDNVVDTKKYEAVVVLVGLLDAKWYLTENNGASSLDCYYRFNEQADRLIAGVDFVKRGRSDRLLIGDRRKGKFSEAEVLMEFLEKQGFKRGGQAVVYGVVGDTYDEAEKVREFVEMTGLKEFVLISSEAHMRRAAATFRKKGLSPALFSVMRMNRRMRLKDFFPRVNGLVFKERILYEMIGYAGYWFQGRL